MSSIFKDNKVCFVTNSTLEPGQLAYRTMLQPLSKYPDDFYIIDGSPIQINGRQVPVYGLYAFALRMIPVLLDAGYDYAIYFDNDCLLIDNDYFKKLFIEFVNGGYCVAGVPDGGVICHRNHNNMMINTFLSFWNIKAIREYLKSNNIVYNDLFVNGTGPMSYNFEKFTDDATQELFDLINDQSKIVLQRCNQFRKGKESAFCAIVRNDITNPVEPNQDPYTYKHDDFEPYYCLIEWLVLATQMPIMFLNALDADLYGDGSIDKTGITSIVVDNDCNPVAFHTWFGRGWNVVPFHTERIKNILKHSSNLVV